MSVCRSCKQPIRWAMTEKGKRLPLDPEPVPDGNVTLERTAGGVDLATVHPASKPPAEGVPRYVSHFATCPDAATHRRRPAKAAKR